MRRFFMVALLLVAVLMMAQVVELRWTGFGGGEEDIKHANAKIAAFQAKFPNIKVVPEIYPDNYTQALLASIAAGNPPDVFLLDAPYMPTFTERGVPLNIKPYLRVLGVNIEEYYPNVLEVFTSPDGKLFGLPKGFTPMVVYYNKKLLKQAGLSEPNDDWTWNDFLKMAQAMTKDLDGDGKIDQYGAYVGKFFYQMCPKIWSYGGEIISPDYKTVAGYLNSPQTIEAVQFFVDLMKKYKVAPEPDTVSALGGLGNMLYTNRIGFYISGHWSLFGMRKYIEEGTLEIGVVRLPRGPYAKSSQTVIYATAWSVIAGTKNPREALQFVAWLAGAEGQKREVLEARIELSGHIPTNDLLVAQDKWGVEKKFVEIIPTARIPIGSRVFDWYKAEDIFAEAMDKIIALNTPVKEALDWAVKEIETKVFGR